MEIYMLFHEHSYTTLHDENLFGNNVDKIRKESINLMEYEYISKLLNCMIEMEIVALV